MASTAIWALDVRPRDARHDPRRVDLCRVLAELGLSDRRAGHGRLYLVAAPPSPGLVAAVERLCVDPLLALASRDDGLAGGDGWAIDLLPFPGVTDAEGESLTAALAEDGFSGVRVRTGHRYGLSGDLSAGQVRRVAERLVHPVVEWVAAFHGGDSPPRDRWRAAFMPPAAPCDRVETVPLRGLDDDALAAVSDARLLALSRDDLRAIRDHYAALGRDPTDVELETIAQTWSEHCAHRTFKATIRHRDPDGGEQEIRGLLKTFIVAATERVARPWVRSAFRDNAGVVAFDRGWEVSFKVETHNHPSAIEPFGGANTGVGGVVRDVLGVSAEPIANTDVLCFGPPDLPPERLPPGVIPPDRMVEGVVAGIADYGNKMGIPTVNGATLFDPDYAANPLVFCGTVGLAPAGARPTTPGVGDLVVVAGGRAGRDGIHGATFSSDVLAAEASVLLGSVVQIGDPIVEKRLADALPLARDAGLYTAITDCGAGGLSSAVGEMASELGAEVDLALVPLKYAGLAPWEVWISEAQERMVLAVPPARWERLRALLAAEGVEATAIGRFTGDGRLRLRAGDRVVADLAGEFLHHGMPLRELASEWTAPPAEAPERVAAGPGEADLTGWLLRALADPNVASKEGIARRYDHEVQGRTVGKPFVGPGDLGPADAAVLRPLPGSRRGIAIGCGINPWYGRLDPYHMALLAVDEALRNVVAVGADPDRVAILDNFCWGNPNLPDRLGGLVRAARGCHDAAVGFRVPFVSGKDSLNNEFRGADGGSHPIPGTLLISALGIVPDVDRLVSMEAKRPGDALYLVGTTAAELGGALLPQLRGRPGARVPVVRPRRSRAILRALHRAMRAGLVRACHDLSEGGLAVAAAEMAIGGGRGLALDLAAVPVAGAGLADEAILFSESATRFLVEVAPEDAGRFERALGRAPRARIGRVTDDGRLRVAGGAGGSAIDAEVAALRDAWRSPALEEGIL